MSRAPSAGDSGTCGHQAEFDPAEVCHRNSSSITVLDWRSGWVCIQETAAGRGHGERDYEVPVIFYELLRGDGSSITGS
jgi:hypothetical protein